MKLPATARVLALCAAPCAYAQSTLPPAQITQIPSPQTSSAQANPTQIQAVPHATPRHLQVLFAAGMLTIHAENASLNGILRQVSQATGMSITGGVTEERVYGNYGPADTGEVLERLLAGTGSNMLLEESSLDRPLTLVLTPRQGGPTPPSPSSQAPDQEEDRDHADLPPQQTRPTPPTGAFPPGPPPATNLSGQQPPTTTTSTDTTQSTTTDQQSPNGVKTPQQIYDQLMKLKQQKSVAPQ